MQGSERRSDSYALSAQRLCVPGNAGMIYISERRQPTARPYSKILLTSIGSLLYLVVFLSTWGMKICLGLPLVVDAQMALRDPNGYRAARDIINHIEMRNDLMAFILCTCAEVAFLLTLSISMCLSGQPLAILGSFSVLK